MHIPTEFHQGEWEGAKMGPVPRNLWKGFANLLQINYGKHEKQGLKAYKAWEVRLNELHLNCCDRSKAAFLFNNNQLEIHV